MLRRMLIGGLVCGFLAGMMIPSGAQAAPDRQLGPERLELFAEKPLAGSLDATTIARNYIFDCAAEMPLSVVVETVSGGLIPALTVVDPAGVKLAEGQSIKENSQMRVAQAFTSSTSGVCGANVTVGGGTAGSYEIRLLGGYAILDKWEKFDGLDDPLRMTWGPYDGEGLNTLVVDGQLRVQVTVDNLFGYAIPDDAGLSWTDLYIQADLSIEGNPTYYEYGFALGLDDVEEKFFGVTFSSFSDWTVVRFEDDWIILQDWTVSPDVDGEDRQPQVAAFIQGQTIRVYFNGTFVGEADLGEYNTEGVFAVVTATQADQPDALTIYYDNVIITRPATAGASLPFGDLQGGQPSPTPTSGLLGMLGATRTPQPVPPSPTPRPSPTEEPETTFTLANWQSTQPADIVGELQQLGVVPAGGMVALNVPTSFGDTSASGFSFYPLGQGRDFRNFVLAYDARLINTGPESGCGMHMRDSAVSSTSALVFEDSYALLGYFDSNGDLTDDSVYDFFPVVAGGAGARNRVVVVAIEENVLMFVNGELIVSTEFPAGSGSVALEMYVSEDENGKTVQTYCQLDNIWVWEF